MLTAIYTVLVFCIIIAIHEFGHFFAAKLCGVTVHEFSIGMGPKVAGFSKNGTDYSIRILPFGGFVKLEGEDGESDDPNAFGNKSAWRRLLILAAGAFMNLLLGFVIFIVIFCFSKGFSSNIVGTVISGSAFEDAGVEDGDRIVYMEGKHYRTSVKDYNDINYFIYKNGGNSATITFKIGNDTVKKTITPKYVESEKRTMFGFAPEVLIPSPLRVVGSAYRMSIFVVKVVISSFVDLIKGAVSMSEMSGPVGIVNEIGTAAKSGLRDVLYLAALISINLGVLNLFPIPALDGGRILFVLIELVRRKPVNREREGLIHLVGFALLLALMAVITYADIRKLL